MWPHVLLARKEAGEGRQLGTHNFSKMSGIFHYIQTPMNQYIYVCMLGMYACIYMQAYMHASMHMCIYVYVDIYICACHIYTSICIYIYTYIHPPNN